MEGNSPLKPDFKSTLPDEEFAYRQTRFKMLTKSRPEEARRRLELGRQDVIRRRGMYDKLAAT